MSSLTRFNLDMLDMLDTVDNKVKTHKNTDSSYTLESETASDLTAETETSDTQPPKLRCHYRNSHIDGLNLASIFRLK